jgi:hypothetical protein
MEDRQNTGKPGKDEQFEEMSKSPTLETGISQRTIG